MASSSSSCSISRYIFYFSLSLLLTLVQPSSTTTFPSQQFEYQTFDKISNFQSQIKLSGDTKVTEDNNKSALQLTGSWNYSSGSVIYKTPIKLSSPNHTRLKYSFDTHFTFTISSSIGDGLVFFLTSSLPNSTSGTSFGLKDSLVDQKTTTFAVEFDTKTNPEYGDMNSNHIGIDVGGLISVKVTNASKLILNNGETRHCWIDYEASSKRVEVRLTATTSERPIDPVLSCPIDLSEMFKGKSVFVGLSSSNSDSQQVTNVLSWGFRLRPVPYWTHSQPLDPEKAVGVDDKRSEVRILGRKSECVVRIVTAVFVGTGCGGLGAFVVVMIWSLFGNRC